MYLQTNNPHVRQNIGGRTDSVAWTRTEAKERISESIPKLLEGGVFQVTVRGEGEGVPPWDTAAGLTEDLPGLLATNENADNKK